MNLLIRGVRVIDPARDCDDVAQDVRLEDGVITAIGRHVDDRGLAVLDVTPADGMSWRVLAPGFVDLHAHLREPGAEHSETVVSGARAGAAGGFTHVLAMANTQPPVDTPERVSAAVDRTRHAEIDVLPVCAVSKALRGELLVDVEECAQAGAAAFSDDGRNAASASVLTEALRRAGALHRPVLVHPEDESAIAPRGSPDVVTVRSVQRPAAAEVSAVRHALQALRAAGSGHLHLQHVSTSESTALLRQARAEGLPVTAEVTPHHLALWTADGDQPSADPLLKVNPPLRSREDRDAVLQALREGVIDAVATDHAPHARGEKTLPYADAAPGMIGLETALAVCLTHGDMGDAWLPVLVARLTTGPYRLLAPAGVVPQPALREGEPASCVLFDPYAEWTVGGGPLQSRSRNTPLLGTSLRGTVLLTVHRGRAVYRDARLPVDALVAARG